MKLLRIAGAVLGVILLSGGVRASDADAAFDQGRKLLAEAMIGEDAKLVPAAKFFIVAQQQYEAEGKNVKAQETQACLYWCKKKMPLAEAETFAQGIPDKFKTTYDYTPETDEAQAYFLRAKDYATTTEDPLLVAIRWFEVADRFAGTEVSLIAQQRSLEAMQQVQQQKVVVDPTDKANLKPTEKGPGVDEAIREAWEPYAEAVADAKKEYIDDLQKALEFEMKKGNLDGANALKAEIERMAGDAETPSEIDNSKAERAAKSFTRAMEKAKDKYRKDLESAMKKATRAGNLDAANRIKEEMEGMGGVSSGSSFVKKSMQESVIPDKGHKQFANGKLREAWGDSYGKWIDLTVINDTLQESVVGGKGHIQYQNGKLREAWGDEFGNWIDLTKVNDTMQESIVEGKGHIQYQNGKLREAWGGQFGKWITINRK